VYGGGIVKCVFAHIGPSEKVDGWHKYQCQRDKCRIIGHSPFPAVVDEYGIERVIGPQCMGGELLPEGVLIEQSITAPAFGPGTELESMLHAAGASSDICGGLCAKHRDDMNRWGVEGCKAHRTEIIDWLREAAYKTWITDQIKIGWALRKEAWFKLSDPIGSLVDEAIRRATARDS
jgi:hypothetical protein